MDFTDNLENFLRQEITWIHVQCMSDAQKVHLDKLVKDGKASNTQAEWHRYLHSLPPDPEKDYYTDSAGKRFIYKTKDYDGDENKAGAEVAFKVNLSQDDWINLYKYFRDNFRSMDKNRDNLDGVFAKPYLDKWFGDSKKDGKPFWKSSPNYSKDALEKMQLLGDFLSEEERDSNGEKIDKLQMLFNLARTYQGAFAPKNKNSFVAFLKNPEIADTDFFNDVQELFSRLGSNAQYDIGGTFAGKSNNFTKGKFDLMSATNAINDGVTEEKISDEQIQDIKLFYPDLIFNLYDKEKRQQAFNANGYPGVVSIINNVKSNNDYKEDAFNKIVPKENDKRTNWQYVEKVWSDYREGTWDKLGNRHRRHKYSSQAGEALVDAIYANKIKPTDGLGKILAEKDKIKAKFYTSNPKSIPQFNWIFDVLGDMEKTAPKAFADALRDGQKMHHIVELIIQRAAREDKLEHAKTMLEMLTVMQYGPFTSDVRDKLFGKDMKWVFFGDLPSFKGNQALTFMANAVDRVIKFGARAAFEIMNYGWRKFQRRGLKFGTAGYKKFMNKMDKWYGDVMMDPNMTPEKLNARIEQEKAERENLQSDIDRLNGEIGLLKADLPPNFSDYDIRKKQFDDDEAKLDINRQSMDTASQNMTKISAAILQLGLPNKLKPSDVQNKIDNLESEIDSMEKANAQEEAISEKYAELEKYSRYMQLREMLDKENSNFNNASQFVVDKSNSKDYVDNKAFFAKPEVQQLLQKESEKKNKETEIAEYDAHIEIMENRKRDLGKNPAKDKETTITDDAGNKKDIVSISSQQKKASELSVYWDFLQSGIADDINPFRHQKLLRTDFVKAQEKLNDKSQFDTLYAQFGEKYMNVGYGM